MNTSLNTSLVSEADQQFIAQFRGNINRTSVAILLKSLQYLGYFPPHLSVVPADVKQFITRQLNSPEDSSQEYFWDSRTRREHFARIRQYIGFRFPTAADKEKLGMLWNWKAEKNKPYGFAMGSFIFVKENW